MLLDYVIIKLSESKTTKGAFTYYIITEGVKTILIQYCLITKNLGKSD